MRKPFSFVRTATAGAVALAALAACSNQSGGVPLAAPNPAAAPQHRHGVTPDGQIVFTGGYTGPSSTPTIYGFDSSNPSSPMFSNSQGLHNLVQVIGVDTKGNLYVDTTNSDGAPSIAKFAPPYTGAPTAFADNTTGGAVKATGEIFGTGPQGGLAEYAPGSLSPTLQWSDNNLSQTYSAKAIDPQGAFYMSPFDQDEVGFGIIKYPASKNPQGVDTLISFPSTDAVVSLAFDGGGNMLVGLQASASQPPKIEIFPKGKTLPSQIVSASPSVPFGNPFGIAFDATYSHIFVPGSVGGSSGIVELTYPGFSFVTGFGPCNCVQGVAVAPPPKKAGK